MIGLKSNLLLFLSYKPDCDWLIFCKLLCQIPIKIATPASIGLFNQSILAYELTIQLAKSNILLITVWFRKGLSSQEDFKGSFVSAKWSIVDIIAFLLVFHLVGQGSTSTSWQLVNQAYPNVFTILQLLATIPVTSSSCERSISKLRLIKTYLRNTMTDYRMNGLALMYAHKEIELNIDTLINKFATMHPRRMRMTNILDDGNQLLECL